MKIVLLGFMGTGKTSIGKILARKMNYIFYDTDQEIEKQEGCSIPQIFAEKGEEYFRQRETQILNELVFAGGDMVIATGGGIVKLEVNRKLIKEKTLPILLKAAPEVIYQRTKAGGRPLLDNPDPLKTIKDLLENRSTLYGEFSRRVDTDNRTKEEIVEKIIKIIGVGENG